jgi:hypothetical protein
MRSSSPLCVDIHMGRRRAQSKAQLDHCGLKRNKRGSIVSKKASDAAKRRLKQRGNKFKKYVDAARRRKGKSFRPQRRRRR